MGVVVRGRPAGCVDLLAAPTGPGAPRRAVGQAGHRRPGGGSRHRAFHDPDAVQRRFEPVADLGDRAVRRRAHPGGAGEDRRLHSERNDDHRHRSPELTELAPEPILTHHVVEALDGVGIHAVSTGNPAGRPIVFIHGFSASWRAWTHQLGDPTLHERYRLVAIDLRGHGDSAGAIGAAQPLPEARVLDETFEGGSALWAQDVEAVTKGLGVAEPVLVGWSYGGVVVQGYVHARGGLAAGERAVLLSTTPVLILPGMPESADGVLPRDAGLSAFMRVTPDND